MKVFSLFLTILIISSFATLAQNSAGKVSGIVLDANNKPLEGATIALAISKDSSVVKSALIMDKGTFIFNNVPFGSYHIFISYMGERKHYNEVIVDANHLNLQIPNIVFLENTIGLKEVSVTHKKLFVEQKIDRTVVNVDALISNAGTSALDVLEKSPGVRVDQNGSISLKGKSGVVIFIDDKPTYLSGGDLESYLRSLPSSMLSEIEIMANPPARYDAAGNAGIINIKTKKQKAKGFNVGLNSSLGQHKYTTTNHSVDFNYRDTKMNIYGNLGYMLRNGFSDLVIKRLYRDTNGHATSIFNQTSNIRRGGYGYNSTLGTDYYITKNTTIGAVLSGNLRNPKSNISNLSRISNGSGALDSNVLARNTENDNFKNGSVNFNVRHHIDGNKSDVAVDLDYISYQTHNDQSFINDGYLPDGRLNSNEHLIGMLSSNIRILSAKADYTLPINERLKLASGLKTSSTKTDNIADYFYLLTNQTIPDYEKTNQFKYQEKINSAYLNLNQDFKNLSIQLGLRLENTIAEGNQLGNIIKQDSSFNRNYTGIFPTLFVLYKLDSLENNQLRFNFGRRIDRPYYQDLNPFISPLDKFTYLVGNPYLQPSYSNKFELSYIIRKRITGTVAYSNIKGQTNETIEIVNDIYYSRPGNIGSTTVFSVALEGSLDPVDWLSLQFYGELASVHSKSNFYTGLLDNRGTNGYLQGMAGFKLGKNWNIQFDGHYQTKITNAQFVYGSKWGINSGISKKISEKASVKLSINDLFYTNINQGTINNLNATEASYRNIGDSRRAQLTLSFRFGKVVFDQTKYDLKGAEEEKSRVKQ